MPSVKEAYRSFLNTDYGAKLYNSFKLILYKEEDSLVQTLNNNYLRNLSIAQKDTLDVCDVGGGDGKRIRDILIFLHNKFGIRFRLDLIDQSKQYIKAFDDSKISSFGETRLFHSLFEDVSLPRRYDLVFLIHSIFAFENGNSIGKVISLQNAKGKVIIVSNAPRSFLAGLKSLVDEGYSDRRYEIDHLELDLQKRDIPFTKFTLPTKWTVSDTRYVDDIKAVLQWISLGRYNEFTVEKKARIAKYISDHSERVGNDSMFSEDEVVLVIQSLTNDSECF